jgi:hypothetical protein
MPAAKLALLLLLLLVLLLPLCLPLQVPHFRAHSPLCAQTHHHLVCMRRCQHTQPGSAKSPAQRTLAQLQPPQTDAKSRRVHLAACDRHRYAVWQLMCQQQCSAHQLEDNRVQRRTAAPVQLPLPLLLLLLWMLLLLSHACQHAPGVASL